jgi:hypothetical protein
VQTSQGAVTPSISGIFTNGLWSGNLTMQLPGTNLILQANDGQGHIGNTSLFSVLTASQSGTSARLTPISTLNGIFSFTLTGEVGPSYTIQASPGLTATNWSTLSVTSPTVMPISLSYPMTTNTRFFRAIVVP